MVQSATTLSVCLVACAAMYAHASDIKFRRQAPQKTALVSELRNRVGIASAGKTITSKAQAGRVISVAEDYGADPSGKTDSSAQIQQAIDDAWKAGTVANRSITLNPNSVDLGGIVLEFGGGHYLLSQPLTLPAAGGGNILFRDGAFHASASFPRIRYLLEASAIPSVADGQTGSHTRDQSHVRYRYLTFENIEFDAAKQAAGGVLMTNFEEIRFFLCLFSGYIERGLWTYGTGNELFIDSCWFHEYIDNRYCHMTSNKTGTAIHLDNNDHSIANTVVFCSLQGLIINGSATVVRNLHVYTEGITTYPYGCAHVTAGTTSVRFVGCYFDGCPVFVDNPSDLQISDSFFLLAEGDSSPGLAPIVLTALPWKSENLIQISGVQIFGNTANGRGSNYTFVELNETNAKFNHNDIHDTVIDNNVVSIYSQRTYGTRIIGSRASGIQVAANTTEFVVDLSDKLLFSPTLLSGVTYSLEIPSPDDTFVQHALVSSRGGIVTVRTAHPISSGILRVSVDQSLP
eukprot:m.1007926 g.1007926  ORF g.1007926 m.1007926 type:complete len:516 (+) comp24057_c0_seq37:343-1890(+)